MTSEKARSDINISNHRVPIWQRQAPSWAHHQLRPDQVALSSRINDNGPKRTMLNQQNYLELTAPTCLIF